MAYFQKYAKSSHIYTLKMIILFIGFLFTFRPSEGLKHEGYGVLPQVVCGHNLIFFRQLKHPRTYHLYKTFYLLEQREWMEPKVLCPKILKIPY